MQPIQKQPLLRILLFFDATVSRKNDGVSAYETVLTTSSAPPASGDLVLAGQKAIYVGLN